MEPLGLTKVKYVYSDEIATVDMIESRNYETNQAREALLRAALLHGS